MVKKKSSVKAKSKTIKKNVRPRVKSHTKVRITSVRKKPKKKINRKKKVNKVITKIPDTKVINIVMGGDAGQGVNELSHILSESLTRAGFYVFNYRDYKSLISGGHSFNVLSISTDPNVSVMSHDTSYDIALVLHPETFKIHSKNLKKKHLILHNIKQHKNNSTDVFLDTSKYPLKVKNLVFAGALLKILGLNSESTLSIMKERFGNKPIYDLDVEAFKLGYDGTYNNNLGIDLNSYLNNSKIKVKRKYYFNGAQGCAFGAIEAGLDVYLAYPMTPSTPLLNTLASMQFKYNYLVSEPDNEIAVVNSALGCSFTGAKTMIGTSGGGFDLMTEALSMQGMSEIPLVFFFAQRPGPGTGVPTYQQQADLFTALHGGHGEIPRVVSAPGDIQESYELTKEAFYLAQKFGCLSIILSDKHIIESGYTVSKINNYFIPPYSTSINKIPGRSIARATSYDHDIHGFTTEDPDEVSKSAKRRLKKLSDIKSYVNSLISFKVHGNVSSKKVVVYWGSTKGAVMDASIMNEIKDKKLKFLQIIYLEPFSNALIKELQKHKAEDVFVIENNTTGLLADRIAEKSGLLISKSNRLLKFDVRPFTKKDIIHSFRGIK